MTDTLRQNRIIYMRGEINESTAHDVVSKMLEYEVSDPTKDILLYIDSYGGYVDSYIAIHDAIKLMRCDVATICFGKAMSAAQMTLMSGSKGKRFVTENARVMVHALSSFAYGNIHELDNTLQESKRLQNLLEGLIRKYTGLKAADVSKLMAKDSYLTADQTVKHGIADYILRKPQDLYSRIKI